MEFLQVTSECLPRVLCCWRCWLCCCCCRCCMELSCAEEEVVLEGDVGVEWLPFWWWRLVNVWSFGRVVIIPWGRLIPSEEEWIGIGSEIGGRGAWLNFLPPACCPVPDIRLYWPAWCNCWWFFRELWLLLMLFNCCRFFEGTLSEERGSREVNILEVVLSCLIARQREVRSFFMESEHRPDPLRESVGVVGSSSEVPPGSVTAFSSSELPVDLSEMPSSSPFSYHSLS